MERSIIVHALYLIVAILIHFGANVYSACPHCSSCLGSTCIQCKSSYYLASGQCYPCLGNCGTCEGIYFQCTSCKSMYWGVDTGCQAVCDSNCLNRHCLDKSGHCLQCEEGWYGFRCQKECRRCRYEQCGLNDCVLGCKTGYYKLIIDNETYCQPCPSNCYTCSGFSTCDLCNEGFYRHKAVYFGEVEVLCLPCSEESTFCSRGCDVSNCNYCTWKDERIACTECAENFHLKEEVCVPIEKCSKGCSTNCTTEGICLGQCTEGLTGQKCTELCNRKCGKCQKDDVNLCEQCVGDFYTTSCSLPCSSGCLRVSGKETCKLKTGHCLNGCRRSFWGNNCTEICSEGCDDDNVTQLCDRDNGTCTLGCREGYDGDFCHKMTTTDATTVNDTSTHVDVSNRSTFVTLEQTDDYPNTTAVLQYTTKLRLPVNRNETNSNTDKSVLVHYIVGAGTVILIIVIAAVTWFVVRRCLVKTSTREDSTLQDMPPYQNVLRILTGAAYTKTKETNEEIHIYDTID